MVRGRVKAKKIFCVVAYDIKDDKSRLKVSKILEKYGVRANYSVFECFFTESQWIKTQEALSKLVKVREDSIVFYPVCVNCFTKIVYYPQRKRTIRTIEIV